MRGLSVRVLLVCSCATTRLAPGFRQVILGPDHPYVAGGLPMDAPGVGFGQNDAFAYQARAFLEEVAGLSDDASLPRCATFDEGVHNMEILAAVATSAAAGGAAVSIPVKDPASSGTHADPEIGTALTIDSQLGKVLR